MGRGQGSGEWQKVLGMECQWERRVRLLRRGGMEETQGRVTIFAFQPAWQCRGAWEENGGE